MMGSLNDYRNHGLIEPVLDKDHFMVSRPEAGIHAKYKSSRFMADFLGRCGSASIDAYKVGTP